MDHQRSQREHEKRSKKHINGAITGLIMALVAYLVLYTINPSLVNFEDNWFFKPRGANSGTGNGGTNILTNVYDKNENGGGTVKYTVNSTYKKQDGEFSYDVKVTKETIGYKDGNDNTERQKIIRIKIKINILLLTRKINTVIMFFPAR